MCTLVKRYYPSRTIRFSDHIVNCTFGFQDSFAEFDTFADQTSSQITGAMDMSAGVNTGIVIEIVVW